MSESEVYNPFAAPEVQDVAVSVDGVDFAALKRTGKGLSLVYISLVLMVLLMFGMVGVVVSTRFAPGGVVGTPYPIILVGLAFMLVGALSFAGTVMCTTVPATSGAKGYILITVALQSIHMLIAVGRIFVGGGFGLTGLSTNLFNTISIIFFVLFLRRLAQFIQRDDLAGRATQILVILVAAILGSIGVGIVAFAARGNNGVFALMGVVAAVVALITFVMYANLINALAKQIRNPSTAPASGHLG